MSTFGGIYLDDLISIMNEREKYFYLIQRVDRDDPWYLYDVAENPLKVMWIPHITPAFKFNTEESVETFATDFLSNRPIQIIRLEYQPGAGY